jgi:hypothetical protein
MTGLDMRCDICESPDFVGVAAVPGFPVSLAWCKHCLARGVTPLFCVEVTICDDSEDGVPLSIEQTVEKHGLDMVLSIVADWYKEQWVYVNPNEGNRSKELFHGPGYYITVEQLIRKHAPGSENSHTNG